MVHVCWGEKEGETGTGHQPGSSWERKGGLMRLFLQSPDWYNYRPGRGKGKSRHLINARMASGGRGKIDSGKLAGPLPALFGKKRGGKCPGIQLSQVGKGGGKCFDSRVHRQAVLSFSGRRKKGDKGSGPCKGRGKGGTRRLIIREGEKPRIAR